MLLPGLDGTGELFQPLMRCLSRAIEPVVCEYPTDPALGYPELLSIAESYLPLDSPYVLLGESFSGPLSIQIASTNPEGLKGLILVNTFLKNPRPLLRKFLRIVPDAFLQSPPNVLMKLMTKQSESGVDATDSLRQVLSRIPPEMVRNRLDCIADIDVSELVSSIRVPTMILRSSGDWLVPRTSLKLMQNVDAQLIVKILPGNHFLLQTSPDKSAKEIEKNCESLVEQDEA